MYPSCRWVVSSPWSCPGQGASVPRRVRGAHGPCPVPPSRPLRGAVGRETGQPGTPGGTTRDNPGRRASCHGVLVRVPPAPTHGLGRADGLDGTRLEQGFYRGVG